MNSILNDLRFAVRLLSRNPVLTLVAVLSLGLGIGANTTIFTLVNDVFLRPLPLEAPERLVSVFTRDERNRQNALGGFMPMSRPNFEDFRAGNEVFESLVAHAFTAVSLSGSGEPEQVPAEIVSAGYFRTLGAPMALGRGFVADEENTIGSAPVTVLSYGLWQRRYGGDPAIAGRAITINGRAFTVVGVTAEPFKGTNAIGGGQLWVPFSTYRETTSGFYSENWDVRRALLFQMTGRLKPGVSLEQARANLTTVAAALAAEYPNDNSGRSVTLVPLAQATINPAFRGNIVTASGLLMVIVGVVLLVACANVANLLLARAAARRQEIALRLSLGASRARLVRQLLIESTVLGLLGGVAGLVIALWARAGLEALRPPFLPAEALAMTVDGSVLAFTTAISLTTGVLFGLVPALQFSRPDLAVELKDRSSQPSGGGRRVTARNALVVAQIALSFVALIGAGLFLRSLDKARGIDPGFDADRLAVLSFDLATQGMPLDAALDRQQQILERVRGLAGVERAAYATTTPLGGGGFLRSVFLEGQDTTDPRNARLVQVSSVGEGYLATMGIPLVRGRDFTPADNAQSPQVVIINETMARQLWPEQEAMGRRFTFFRDEQFTEVVGVARDSKYNFLGEEPQPFIYRPLPQAPQAAVTLTVRSAGPDAALGTVRAVVQQMEPNMPLVGVFTMADVFEQALWAARMGALLLAVFGGLALLLASIGVYGVMAYAVSQRTRELGIRLALGASGSEVRRMVLRQGLTLAGLGIAVGLVVALLLTNLVSNLLYGVSATDAVTFTAIPLILAAVAALAIVIPARRASRVDPVIALRSG
ncbi:MAG TPA: ABC transporter permease [Vicinamibacterales bacterium]|nr:ABC transporter permease [Vicinamibacterales bacterium]